MLLSILIVNYNGLRFLDECFNSIRRFVKCEHEIIVVDNASSDGSVEYIRANYPGIKLIASEVNTGFTGGNNLAASAASGDLLLLLNNDTVILSDVEPAINEMKFSQIGIVGAYLQYADGKNQPSIGFEHTPLRILLSWLGVSNIQSLPNMFRRVETNGDFYQGAHGDVDWVSGAFLLTRRALWERLGGLDEKYFMYVEDVDYCLRVRETGHLISYIPTVRVLHYEGAGKPWIGELALLRTMASYRLYLSKYYGGGTVRLTLAALGAVLLARSIAYQLGMLKGHSKLLKEKRDAYFKAARKLWGAS